MSVNELTQILELDNLKDRIWNIQATTAITGDGVYEALDWLKNNA